MHVFCLNSTNAVLFHRSKSFFSVHWIVIPVQYQAPSLHRPLDREAGESKRQYLAPSSSQTVQSLSHWQRRVLLINQDREIPRTQANGSCVHVTRFFFLASIHLPHSYRCDRADSRAALVSSLIFPHGLDGPAIRSIIRRQSGRGVDEGLGWLSSCAIGSTQLTRPHKERAFAVPNINHVLSICTSLHVQEINATTTEVMSGFCHPSLLSPRVPGIARVVSAGRFGEGHYP